MNYRVELVVYESGDVIWKGGRRSLRMAEKEERGLNINLNHETHYTRIVEVDE